jgi:hypothetical protein
LLALARAEGGGGHEEEDADHGQPEQTLHDGADDRHHEPHDEQEADETPHGELRSSTGRPDSSVGPTPGGE